MKKRDQGNKGKMKNTKDKKIRILVQIMEYLIILSARKRRKEKN